MPGRPVAATISGLSSCDTRSVFLNPRLLSVVNNHQDRKIYTAIQKDQVMFLKTHADIDGEYTLVEVELANGGGVGLHYKIH
jgi:hypothetical protein